VLRLLPREQWKAPQPRRAGRAVASAARGEEAEAMQAEEGAEEAVVDEDDEEEGEVAGEGRPEPSGEVVAVLRRPQVRRVVGVLLA
jgi:hypothetical protein